MSSVTPPFVGPPPAEPHAASGSGGTTWWTDGWELFFTAEKGGPSEIAAQLTEFLAARPAVAAAMRVEQVVARDHDMDTKEDLNHVLQSFFAVCRRAQVRSIAAFLEAGLPVNWHDGMRRNALSIVLEYPVQGASQAIDRLLSAGADVNCIDILGNRPIDYCVNEYAILPDEQAPILRALLQYGSLPAKQ